MDKNMQYLRSLTPAEKQSLSKRAGVCLSVIYSRATGGRLTVRTCYLLDLHSDGKFDKKIDYPKFNWNVFKGR